MVHNVVKSNLENRSMQPYSKEPRLRDTKILGLVFFFFCMSEVLFLLSEAFYRLSKLHFCSIKIFQSAFHFSSNFKIVFTNLLQWMNYIKTCIVITTKVMELSNTKILTNIYIYIYIYINSNFWSLLYIQCSWKT